MSPTASLPAAYHINLPHFEGPFDLLLFFIERDELDIQDIPIARVTDDYLAYVRAAERLDISLAGEFVVVAATLMSIKARALLPRMELDESGEPVDPRGDLVEQLLEYKRYKVATGALRSLETARAERHGRGFEPTQFEPVAQAAALEAVWESVTLYKLAKAFEAVLARQSERRARPRHRVVRWPYTIRDQSARILRTLELRARVPFAEVFGDCENRVHAVVTFLALLELLNGHRVRLRQRPGINSFWLAAGEAHALGEPVAQGVLEDAG